MKKIDLMYHLFGKKEGLHCCECKAFYRKRYGDRTYRKCKNYGDTQSESTDWKASYTACGLAPDGEYYGKLIIEIAKRGPKAKDDEPLDGQMELDMGSENNGI